mmetsp:Transcript_100001/g.260749  ORF Transcript_100001/g.260749 Transcript_100001/m.260749 type:complete len:667 (-) Transcript_100001:67-2067(-)
MGAYIAGFLRNWVQVFLKHCGNNDYLLGTLAACAMTSVAGVVRDGAAWLFQAIVIWVQRRLWVSVRLEEKDSELVLAWLRERPEVHRSSQLSLFSQKTAQTRVYEYEPEIQVTTRLCSRTKEGKNRFIWITRRERGDASGERRLPGCLVSFFGSDKSMLEHILEMGRNIQRRRREKYLTVVQVYDYGKEHGLNWLHPQDKDRKQPGRSISSVVLPRCPLTGLDQAEALLEDAREFLNSELWYTERGIPYRRGYLLHGIPGGGKSSLVMAVASELRLPIYMLQLSSEQMNDETLNTLLQYGMHDPPTILLLEDVDLLHSVTLHRASGTREKDEAKEDREELDTLLRDASSGREAERKSRRGRLSLSGLLNALDGPTATTGRLLFMTTNARDRLDSALLRSGRIDYEVEFKEAQPEQMQRLFTRFYADFRSSPGASGGGLPERVVQQAAFASDLEDGTGEKAAAAEEGILAAPAYAAPSGSLVAEKSDGPRRSTDELAKLFAEQISASGVHLTTADIQRHLMKRKTDPERALKELPVLLRSMSESTANQAQKAAEAKRAEEKRAEEKKAADERASGEPTEAVPAASEEGAASQEPAEPAPAAGTGEDAKRPAEAPPAPAGEEGPREPTEALPAVAEVEDSKEPAEALRSAQDPQLEAPGPPPPEGQSR